MRIALEFTKLTLFLQDFGGRSFEPLYKGSLAHPLSWWKAMSVEDEKNDRIGALVDWWSSEIPQFIAEWKRTSYGGKAERIISLDDGGQPKWYDSWAKTLIHIRIEREAKKRFAISELTARDYSTAVFGATEPQLVDEALKQGLAEKY